MNKGILVSFLMLIFPMSLDLESYSPNSNLTFGPFKTDHKALIKKVAKVGSGGDFTAHGKAVIGILESVLSIQSLLQ